MKRFKDGTTRAKWWDYNGVGEYFITINTFNRNNYFGEIQRKAMNLSLIGKIVEVEWLYSPYLRPGMEIELGEFVVMPNHFHGIIKIGKSQDKQTERSSFGNTSEFKPQSKNLASVLRGFKSAVTTKALKTNPDFGWQPKYYDVIIRDQRHLKNVEKYIRDNPSNWNPAPP